MVQNEVDRFTIDIHSKFDIAMCSCNELIKLV